LVISSLLATTMPKLKYILAGYNKILYLNVLLYTEKRKLVYNELIYNDLRSRDVYNKARVTALSKAGNSTI
jgi:hypothetical protein